MMTRDMKVKVVNKKTGDKYEFEGDECTFEKRHFPGAHLVDEVISCEDMKITKKKKSNAVKRAMNNSRKTRNGGIRH